MFFLYELERVITLHPSFFGSRNKEYLTRQLLADVEGKFIDNYYVICVMENAYDISEGKVLPGSAEAEYTLHYRAVVWRPFKGESIDGIVGDVTGQGFWANIGPLNIFVSRFHIPSDIKWDPDATPPQFTDNGDQVIERGTQLRIKVIGVRTDVTELYAIGSIKEDYLGSVTHVTTLPSANNLEVLYELHNLAATCLDAHHIPPLGPRGVLWTEARQRKGCEGNLVVPKVSGASK
ncbi:DNA-directed RNA polymerase II subunit [Trapelia coarctata]|nr:DNA-directed RNA polymerase II subunit [Trapelia coarctata]